MCVGFIEIETLKGKKFSVGDIHGTTRKFENVHEDGQGAIVRSGAGIDALGIIYLDPPEKEAASPDKENK